MTRQEYLTRAESSERMAREHDRWSDCLDARRRNYEATAAAACRRDAKQCRRLARRT